MNNDNQRQILDSYGELDGLLEAYRGEFRRFSKLSRKLREMQEENKTRELRTAQLTAIIEELTELDLDYGDGERMEEELQKIRSTAKIQGALFTANNLLNGEENPGAVELVRQSMNSFAAAGAVLPEADALYRRLEELLPELEDISSEAASMAFGADDNEEREADLEDRVSAMKHSCRKYNMDSDQLVDYLGECRQELSQLSGLDGEIERLSEEKHELAGQVKRMAEDISAKRREASEKLSAEICEVLRFLNMPNVTLTFDVRPDKITINGMDEVEILISANAGEEPKPLNKTASGGELSRVMLAVKSVMAEGDDIPTMIFDEVDAGISGRTAAKVGIKLAETARKRQVLCITHLAQIAALAQTHMLIEKQTDDKRTYTRIVPLDHEGRKQELARIMDGGLTESGLKAAGGNAQQAGGIMNAWYMLAAYVGAILICLALCAVSLAVMMHGIVKQRRLGGRLAFLIAAGAVTAAVLLFTNSHATYYRFNDWAVSGSTVQDIVKRYGEPDINMYTPGRGRQSVVLYLHR